jgi:hypothetical protein
MNTIRNALILLNIQKGVKKDIENLIDACLQSKMKECEIDLSKCPEDEKFLKELLDVGHMIEEECNKHGKTFDFKRAFAESQKNRLFHSQLKI